ncbi:MAG: glycosyltransferase family 4 protein [Bdellovibrionales bacterium]|nr:glycosyltransferase family 4 protein [Bdellovibrionales bacterium]
MRKRLMPSQLRICIVAAQFPILGRAADHGFLWPVAKGLARQGHDVTILSWKNPQRKREIEQDGVKGFFLGEGTSRTKADFPVLVNEHFAKLHRDNPFHIVHSVDNSGIEIGKLKRNYRVAMAYDVEATRMSEIFQILGFSQETLSSLFSIALLVTYRFLKTYLGSDRMLLRTADSIFVTSPQQRLALERYYLYPETKVYTVPYGIEIGDLSPREKSEEFRKKLGIPGNSRVILTKNNMTELEEFQNLLKAFERLAIKKPTSRLIIIGDGPLRKQFEFEMLNLALGSKVIFTGEISNVEINDYIALADIFVNLSSRTSGFEPMMLEAMAQKKVIVGSEVSPIATIVEQGQDGFLLRPADTTSLTELFLRVFDGSISTENVGEAARNKVLNLFDTQKMVRVTIAAYKKALLNTGLYSRKVTTNSKQELAQA